jgi:DNA-directed RNA polymerase subunit RPC12/RpoP
MSKSKYQQQFDEGKSLNWNDLLGWEKEVNEEEKLKAVTEYKCGKCGKSYRLKIGLNLHIRAQNCEGKRDFHSLTDQKNLTETEDGKKFECDKCGRRLKWKYSLIFHFQTHETGVKHKCQICLKSFKTDINRYNHELRHKAPTVKCGKCGKELKNRTTLKIHMQTHETVKHKCQICFKYFKTEVSRYHHERLHTAPTVKCGRCGKELKNRATLNQHMSKVHSKIN